MKNGKLESDKSIFFVALGIDIVITTLVLISDFWGVSVMKDVEAGRRTMDQSTLSTMEFWDKFAALLILTLFGVGYGLVRWMKSCYSYAKEVIGAAGFKNEGWTTKSWIIPFFNTFKPYQVINEIYKAGSPTYSLPDEWKKQSSSGLLLSWWLFWVASHFIIFAVGKQVMVNTVRDDITLTQAAHAVEMHAFICMMSLVVSGLWIVVAKALTSRLIFRQESKEKSVRSSFSAFNITAIPLVSEPPKQLKSEIHSDGLLVQMTGNISTRAPIGKVAESTQNVGIEVSHSAIADEFVTEEQLWAIAMKEVEGGQRRLGVWAKAFAESEGDETKAKVSYLKARVIQLGNEANAYRVQLEASRKEAAARAAAEATVKSELVKVAISKFAKNEAISNEELTLVVKYADKQYLVSLCDVKGDTLLHECAQRDLVFEVKALLDAGADPRRLNIGGLCPELLTGNRIIRRLCSGLKITFEQLEVLVHPPLGLCPNCSEVLLISDHTCPQCKALFGPLSLYKILEHDDQAMLTKLKSEYLSGKKPTANQIKYLVAASIDDKTLIKLADPNKYGATLLHWCASFSLVREGKILLELGANPRAKDAVNRMPYEYCTDDKLLELLRNSVKA